MANDTTTATPLSDIEERARIAASLAREAESMPEWRTDAMNQTVALASIAFSLAVIADVLVAQSKDSER